MKKDKEWLIKRVENYIPLNDKTVGHVVDNILDIIRQLDEPEADGQLDKLANFIMSEVEGEPSQNQGVVDAAIRIIKSYQSQEVLSLKWIDDNSVYASHGGITDEYVHVDDLKELLVPKQESQVLCEGSLVLLDHIGETIKRAFDVETISKTIEMLSGMTIEQVAEGFRDGKLEFVDDLDEPEMLSQEESINIILDDLKEHIKEQQSLSQNVGMAHTPSANDTYSRKYDFVLECIDEYEPSGDLQSLLVPKQELPVIPSYMAEYLELAKSDVSLMRVLEIANRRDELPKWEKEYDWISTNDEVFARAWLDGYTAEEEEKYCLKIGNLYLAEPLGDMTSDIVRMTRDKEIAYQFTDEKSIATHLDKFEGIKAVKIEELEE